MTRNPKVFTSATKLGFVDLLPWLKAQGCVWDASAATAAAKGEDCILFANAYRRTSSCARVVESKSLPLLVLYFSVVTTSFFTAFVFVGHHLQPNM